MILKLNFFLIERNLIAQAQSGKEIESRFEEIEFFCFFFIHKKGTGKTAAFVLGMLSKCDPNMNAPQAICICPTRELARQIQTVVLGLGKFMKIRVALCCGGEKRRNKFVIKFHFKFKINFRVVPKTIKSHVIVGTPGKILEAMEYNTFDPKKLRIFVLDEADQMIDNEALGIQTRKLAKYSEM